MSYARVQFTSEKKNCRRENAHDQIRDNSVSNNDRDMKSKRRCRLKRENLKKLKNTKHYN